MASHPIPLPRRFGSRTQPSVLRRLQRRSLRDPALPLTVALGLPAMLAAFALGRVDLAAGAFAASVVAAAAQALVLRVARIVRYRRRHGLVLIRLTIALILAATLAELVIPTAFSLYIPVVGLGAAIGAREGVATAMAAVALYVIPFAARSAAPEPQQLSRGVAAAAVCALVAIGSRYFVGRLQSVTRELRMANVRERRRVRQIDGVEQVGRLLAAGPTSESFEKVVDLLVERFGFEHVSMYLADVPGRFVLGAQRGYEHPITEFDGTHGVIGRAIRSRKVELVSDVSVDPDYESANAQVVSEICAPLIVGDDLVGVVNVESTARVLDRTDLALVVAVAEQLAGYVALGRERQRLAELAITDGLTGLHNRRYLDDTLRRVFAARARQAPEQREELAAILFDLDHFGALNKDHGHSAGDVVLRRFGRLLAERFREADIVARYGGEEFLVVMVGASLPDAERRAHEVRAALADPRPPESADQPTITVSAGCTALQAGDVGDPATLLAATDVALSLAKRAGRDCVVSAGL